MPTSPHRPGQGPHSGDDTYDRTGHAHGQLAERRGAWPGDDLTASLTGQAERFLPELLTSARLNGHTRHDIVQALATSPDQGRRRSGPAPRSPTAAGPTTPETAKGGPKQHRSNHTWDVTGFQVGV